MARFARRGAGKMRPIRKIGYFGERSEPFPFSPKVSL